MGPLHEQLCSAFTWRRPGVPALCTGTRVNGAGQRRGCRNLGTKTCPSKLPIVPSGSHPSCGFPPQLDGPAASLQDLFFLSPAPLPTSTPWLPFQSYFLFRPLRHSVLNAPMASPTSDSSEVVSLGHSEECKPRILQKLPTAK